MWTPLGTDQTHMAALKCCSSAINLQTCRARTRLSTACPTTNARARAHTHTHTHTHTHSHTQHTKTTPHSHAPSPSLPIGVFRQADCLILSSCRLSSSSLASLRPSGRSGPSVCVCVCVCVCVLDLEMVSSSN